MSLKKPGSIIVAAVALAALLFWRLSRQETQPSVLPTQTPSQSITVPAALLPPTSSSTAPPRSSVKRRAGEFNPDEKAEFMANFQGRYKPAIEKWCVAFKGYVPFNPDDVTAEKLVERIGMNSAYREYIFVVGGITLGVRDTKGMAQVDYLNAPQQTRKMTTLPDGTQAPITSVPVTSEEIAKMLAAVSGTRFPAQEIRMIPSGLSGSLNGGVLANVGGDAENIASWKYDMAFGPDGKLAYYLKGNQ